MIDLSSLTAKNLKNGNYDLELPEFVALRQTIENNPWHDHQSVFDHIVRVMEEMEILVEKDNLSILLSEKVSIHSRKELLLLATLLHDVAKGDLLITDTTGQSRAPGHEQVGAARAHLFASRFQLDTQETAFVKQIILYHGFIDAVIGMMIAEDNLSKYQAILSEVAHGIELELVLFIYADVLGSDLRVLQKNDFDKRIVIINQLLQHYD